jgi:uncharacterized phage protein (TIGR02220 family)
MIYSRCDKRIETDRNSLFWAGLSPVSNPNGCRLPELSPIGQHQRRLFVFYYQFNIGDYLKHTAHLTPLEDIAYRRLLDFYYDTEVPIPIAIPLVSRRLRIPAETVKVVLDEFFQLTDEGYRNKRADAEIVAYHAFLQKQKANGIKGGRPKTKPTDNPPVSQHEPKITLNTNREPLNTKRSNTLSGKPDASDQFYVQSIEILEYLNANTQRNYRPVDSNLKLIAARLKSGATDLQCREVIFNKCEQWGKDPKMSEYLRPATLFNSTKFEQYLGEINAMS